VYAVCIRRLRRLRRLNIYLLAGVRVRWVSGVDGLYERRDNWAQL
jgi:hypothetical protein